MIQIKGPQKVVDSIIKILNTEHLCADIPCAGIKCEDCFLNLRTTLEPVYIEPPEDWEEEQHL